MQKHDHVRSRGKQHPQPLGSRRLSPAHIQILKFKMQSGIPDDLPSFYEPRPLLFALFSL